MSDINNNDVISILVKDLLKEKRSERRWKNIRFLFWFALFAYSIIGLFTLINHSSSGGSLGSPDGKYYALIRLDGMIAPGRDFSAEEVLPTLRQAFKDKKAEGVVLNIDSPGGTPVQASIIHDAILQYKNKYHKKVIIVGEDMLASGAYFIAVAGDKIYVNPNTITGSIGVVMKGFGFVDAMKKFGVERRVYTAGTNKDRLDPFLPLNAEDEQKIQQVMGEVHQNFVQAVMDGRKGKLHADTATLFNGDFWSGQSALKLGLVDGLGNLMDVSEKEFGTTQFKEYGASNNFLRSLSGQFSSALDSIFFTY